MNGYKIVNQNHIHFITPTVVGWYDVFSRKVYKDIVIDSLKYCQEKKGLVVYAYVIMTNHIHLVVSAKEGFRLSDIIRDFKKHTSKKIIKEILSNQKESRQEWMLRLFKYYAKNNQNNKLYQFWKRDNHPIELVLKDWLWQKINYIHQNPIRAGVTSEDIGYLYSSARNYAGMNSILEVQLVTEFDF
jgi:REP element-mobilizing transposase RayT